MPETNFRQVGKAKQLTVSSPDVTITDLLTGVANFDPELILHWGGNTRYPRYVIGNDNTTITVTTSDANAFIKLAKGIECTTVKLEIEAPYYNVLIPIQGNQVTQNSGSIVVGLTISNARVDEAIQISGGGMDGKPAEFSIKFRAAKVESTGADPTLTFDVS